MAFFRSFPLGVYANTQVVDITRRVAFHQQAGADRRTYMPYEVPAGERADQVAQYYYGSPENVWMVYLSAGIVDPYHDWYKSGPDFEAHVVGKYGSQEDAHKRTHCWRTTYPTEAPELTATQYAMLPEHEKKYWEASVNPNGRVNTYVRRDEEWTVTTNMVLAVNATSNGSVTAGEVVEVFASGTLTGQAEVAWANTTALRLINVVAEVGIGNQLRGQSGVATVTGVHHVANTIPAEERPYWERVSAYEHEREKNEARRHIRLADQKYVNELNTGLRATLQKD